MYVWTDFSRDFQLQLRMTGRQFFTGHLGYDGGSCGRHCNKNTALQER